LSAIVIGIGTVMILYWISQIIFFVLHKRWSSITVSTESIDTNSPVSVIHPIKDLDFELYKNLQSWTAQDYSGEIEHIFSFQDNNDKAIPVVSDFIKNYPSLKATIIINNPITGINGKSSNMIHGIKISKYENLLFVDSDIRVHKNFIQKMIRPLSKKNTGATTCGQVNSGGNKFWTRFFTYLQNNETDFIWAYLTKIGIPMGITGAAFAMKKETIKKVGGLESYGDSLLEDFHLGHKLTEMGYKLILGPFIRCHVDELSKENSINYAKRVAVGLKMHIAWEFPAFIFMIFWHWGLFIASLFTGDISTIFLSFLILLIRIIYGIIQRIITCGKIHIFDFIIPLFFDWFAVFYLTIFVLIQNNATDITWRGIAYKVKKGGYIDTAIEAD
jgi:cellulose synthase/poly-beta-1,6-N-acetylglucosamine synthase-like glycosyltransferase